MTQTQALTTIFDYQSSQVRVVMRGDTPWFVAKDVATVLGIANSRDAIARLKPSEKDDVGISDAIGRMQRTTIISEYALYKLAFRSNKPEAEAFTDWVASEVLPAIRTTGMYAIQPQAPTSILKEQLRERLLANEQNIPDGYFTIGSVALRHFLVLVDKFEHLDGSALLRNGCGGSTFRSSSPRTSATGPGALACLPPYPPSPFPPTRTAPR